MTTRLTKRQICSFTWAIILFLVGLVLIVIGLVVMKKILPDIVHDQVLKVCFIYCCAYLYAFDIFVQFKLVFLYSRNVFSITGNLQEIVGNKNCSNK